MSSFFRRKYLINPKFQVPFIIRMIVINLLVLLILYAATIFIFYRFNFLGNDLGFDSDHFYYNFVKEQMLYISAVFGAFAISSSIVLAVYGIFLSHRIAGPLENLKIRFKTAKDLKGKTRFRRDDFFHELADAYNDHLEDISQKDVEVEVESDIKSSG